MQIKGLLICVLGNSEESMSRLKLDYFPQIARYLTGWFSDLYPAVLLRATGGVTLS